MKRTIVKTIASVMLLTALILTSALLTGCGNVTVPDVVGKTQADAEAALTDAGLKMTVQRERFSDKNPEGTVDKMMTAAGETVSPGSEIKVIISKGEGVCPPNLTSLTGYEAESYLIALKLKPIMKEEYSDEVPEGNVISYTDAGNTLPVGSEVTVVVSKGPKP